MHKTMLLLMLLALMVAACDNADDHETRLDEEDAQVEPVVTANDIEEGMAAEGGDETAALVVESYLASKVAGDFDGVQENLCSAMEADLEREANSFAGVEAEVEGLDCTHQAGSNTVICEGEIVAVYGGENRVFELGSYDVVQEDGEWKWCGETAMG